MNVELEEVIALLNELEAHHTQMALTINEEPMKQYALIGQVEGIRASKRKLVNHYERERLNL